MMFIKHDAKKYFVMPAKDNRKVALSDEKLAAGEFVKIKDLEPGESILVSSDIELSGAKIIEIYQRRWGVEEYQKSLKSNVSLAKSPTKKPRTQANHLFASICAFMRLEILSRSTMGNKAAAPA